MGRDNPADLFTKHLDRDTIERHCRRLNSEFPEGRAATAPTFHSSVAGWQIHDNHDTTTRHELAMLLPHASEAPDGYE